MQNRHPRPEGASTACPHVLWCPTSQPSALDSPPFSEVCAEMTYQLTESPQDVAAASKVDAADPFARDPPVHPALTLHASKPCTAEVPRSLLLQSWVTPSDLWYVRSHHPVPKADSASHTLQARTDRPQPQHTLTPACSARFFVLAPRARCQSVPSPLVRCLLQIRGPGLKPLELSIGELKKRFPKKTVTTTLQARASFPFACSRPCSLCDTAARGFPPGPSDCTD